MIQLHVIINVDVNAISHALRILFVQCFLLMTKKHNVNVHSLYRNFILSLLPNRAVCVLNTKITSIKVTVISDTVQNPDFIFATVIQLYKLHHSSTVLYSII